MWRTLALAGATAALPLAVSSGQAVRGVETFDAAWTIIRDTHFDPAMNGVDWTAVRRELKPLAAAARTEAELREVIRGMLGRLGQSHFALIPSGAAAVAGVSLDESGAPGFDVRLVGRDLLVTHVDALGSAAASGVRTGWKLTAVDSRPVSQILDALPGAMPERLRQVEVWRMAQSWLRGAQGSSVELTFEDGAGRQVTRVVTRRAEAGQLATVGNLPTMFVRVESAARRSPAGTAVGVIAFNVWMPAVDALFQRAVDEHRSAGGIVLDLRGNPGGLAGMLMGISGHFLDERRPLGVMKTRDGDLKFMSNPRLVSSTGERVEPFAGPLAILVDALTGSASECFTGGMQSLGRARVFGQISMGQALPALFDKLPNGDVLIHAYGDFVTADGTRLEGRGVIPDEAVPLRREDLLEGRDATLERALAWIDRGRTGSGDDGWLPR
ncbi:MAG TPA: S41 family peptidase [Vicinamibacterales bacterium]|nr:S41 family peptidase [Vicinamibacterales bacterium]